MKQPFSFGTVTTHLKLLRKLSMLFLIILPTGILMSKVNGQAIYVDKVDYMPGDAVKIYGYAWRPGELVSVVLTENYLHPQGLLVTTKSFTCDYQGKFTGVLYTVVEANLGAFFQVKASGSITNHVCTTVFNDAGGDYSIDFSAYDPQYYLRRTVGNFPSGYFPLEGNLISPLGAGGGKGYTMHTRTLESTDKEPPVIICPAPITVACASAIPDPVKPEANDNCGIAKVEWIGDVKGNETCESRFTIIRTYRATDVNGLTAECTQVITVYDNIAPLLKPGAVFPAGQTGMNLCKASIPAGPTVEEIKALYEDNCGGPVVVFKSGEPTGDDCSWSVTYSYIVKDMCRNYVADVPKVTFSGGDMTPPVLKPGASFPVGQTGINGCKSEIPTGPTVDAIKALYTENCSNVIVVNLGGKVTGDDCSWSVTYTYRVKDACYNEILPRPTITYSGGDKTPPALRPGASFPVGRTGINGCKSEIPAGPTVDEIKTLYTDNCGGSVIVLSPDVIVTGDDKNWSVTYTYRVKDACYNEVLPRPAITYSGGHMTAPVLKPGATIPVGETGINQPISSMPEGPSAEEIGSLYIDNCGNGIVVTKLEGKVTGDDSIWTVTYTYVITDTFNNEVLPGPSVTYSGSSKTPPTILLDNGETEYNIEGCDMEFRLPKPVVTAECNGDIDLKAYVGVTEIDLDSYRFENEGVTIVTFIATDACGNSSSATVTVNREICIDKSHCTYTQDWYGSQGSTNCVFIDGIYQKMDALSMMNEAFGDLAKVTFGNSSTNKYFELMRESISGTDGYEGIFKMLPGGGTAAALIGPANSLDPIGRTAGRWPNVPRSTELSNRGTIMNGLLSQTIALFFNLENDESLGEFELTGRYMVTAKSVDCGSEIAVPNSSSYVEFPQSVLDYFSTKNLAGNVYDLYNLANDVLGGIEKSVPASDVEKAVVAINKGFNGCRLLVEFTQSVPAVPGAPATGSVTTPAISGSNELSEVKLTVYPNPFAQVVRFEIRMVKNSHVRVDIYSHSGSLLGMILNEDLSEGDIRTVEFDGTKYPHSSFLYRITTNSTLLNGTMLKTK